MTGPIGIGEIAGEVGRPVSPPITLVPRQDTEPEDEVDTDMQAQRPASEATTATNPGSTKATTVDPARPRPFAERTRSEQEQLLQSLAGARAARAAKPLEPTPALLAKQARQALLAGARARLESVRDVGRLLIRGKAAVGHGGYKAWVEEQCRFSTRSAANYVRVATRWPELEAGFASNPQRLADLSLAACLGLLAKPARERRDRPRPEAQAGPAAPLDRDDGVDPGADASGPSMQACQPAGHDDRDDEPDSPADAPAGVAAAVAEAPGPGAPAGPCGAASPGVDDRSDRGVLGAMRGHFQAGLDLIRAEFRNSGDDPRRASRLWGLSLGYREQIVLLLQAENPQALADCERCGGRGRPGDGCRDCERTGVRILGRS